MKQRSYRLMSALMAAAMVISLLPASALAALRPAQKTVLPVVEEGGVELMALEPAAADTYYSYVGAPAGETWRVDLLAPDGSGDRLKANPTADGVLQLVNGQGEVVCSSQPTGAYAYDQASGGVILTGMELTELKSVPAGAYTLQLSAGTQLYPCLQKAEVLGDDVLFVKNARLDGMYFGREAFDVHLTAAGFRTEAELKEVTLELLEGSNVVARSTGSFRDVNAGVPEWSLTARMKLEPGKTLADTEYRLAIRYSGQKRLVTGAVNAVRSPIAAAPAVSGWRITDPQKSVLTLELTDLTAGSSYRLTALESHNGEKPLASMELTASAAQEEAELTLTRGGGTVSMKEFSKYIIFEICPVGDERPLSRLKVANPYYGSSDLTSAYVTVEPSRIPGDGEPFRFRLTADEASAGLFKSSGNVVTLLCEDKEVGRCEELTRVPGTTPVYTGTMTGAPAKAGYPLRLMVNGVKAAELNCDPNPRLVSWSATADNREGLLFTAFGGLRMEFTTYLTKDAEVVLLDSNTGDLILTSGPLTGETQYFREHYVHTFTAAQLEALKPGSLYAMGVFWNNRSDGKILCAGSYVTDKLPLEPDMLNFDWEMLNRGSQDTVTAEIKFQQPGYYGRSPRNITEADLDVLKNIVFSDGVDQIPVTGVTGAWAGSAYRVTMKLAQPLPKGSYTAAWTGKDTAAWPPVEILQDGVGGPRLTGEVQSGTVPAAGLSEGAVYTGKLYRGYECVTPNGFPMTLLEEGGKQSLYFDRTALADLPAGDYRMRMYMDQVLLGEKPMKLEEERLTVSVDPVTFDGKVSISVQNSGGYRYLRWAESREGLNGLAFQPLGDSAEKHTFEGADGPRTLYVELSRAVTPGSPANVIIPVETWVCRAGDFDLRVPEEIEGVLTPVDGRYVITASTGVPGARVWLRFYNEAGQYATREMTGVGPGADGRYVFTVSCSAGEADGFLDPHNTLPATDTFYYRDTRRIRIFATGQGDGSRIPDRVGDSVRRELLLSVPQAPLLPQIETEKPKQGYIFSNQNSFLLYGYAAPNTTLTLKEGEAVLDTVKAGANGRFEFTISETQERVRTLAVVTADGQRTEFTYETDFTAPQVDSIRFEGGHIRWEYTGDEAELRCFKLIITRGGRSRTKTLDPWDREYRAEENDGNTYEIRAVDFAGNYGSKTLTNPDTVKPQPPQGLTVSSRTTGWIQLSWDDKQELDAGGIRQYHVYCDGVKIAVVPSDPTVPSNERAYCKYKVTGLKPATQYRFAVQSEDFSGNLSETMAETQASTDELQVEPPKLEPAYILEEHPDKLIDMGETGKHYSWYAARSLTMKYRPVGTETWSETPVLKKPVLNPYGNLENHYFWDVSGSADGYLPVGQYQVCVNLVDRDGGSADSGIVDVELKLDDMAPTFRYGIGVEEYDSDSIRFSIQLAEDNVGVNHYRFYRDNVLLADPLVMEIVEGEYGTNGYWSETGLTPGQNHTYRLEAVDARDNVAQVEREAAALDLAFAPEYQKPKLNNEYLMDDLAGYIIGAEVSVTNPLGTKIAGLKIDLEYRLKGTADWTKLPFPANEYGYNGYIEWSVIRPDGTFLPEGDYQVRFSCTDGKLPLIYTDIADVRLNRDHKAPTIGGLWQHGILPKNGESYNAMVPLEIGSWDEVWVKRLTLEYAPAGSQEFKLIREVLNQNEPAPSQGQNSKLELKGEWDALGEGLPNGDYQLRIRACDSCGNVGEKLLTITLDTEAPPTPDRFTLTGTSRYIEVMWDPEYPAPADFKTFTLWRGTSPQGPFEELWTGRSIGYRDTGSTADAGVTYYYYLTAQDKLGNVSKPTPVLSAQMQYDTEGPTAIDMLPSEGANVRRRAGLVATFKDNYRMDRVEFYCQPQGQTEWTLIGTDKAKGLVQNQKGSMVWVIPGDLTGVCRLKAVGYDASVSDLKPGETPNTPAEQIVTVNILPYNPPAAPVVQAQAGYRVADLSWTYSGDQDTLYRFEVLNADTGEKVAETDWASERSCQVRIETNVDYHFKVVAVDIYDETAASEVITVRSLPEETVAPTAAVLPQKPLGAVGRPINFSAAESWDNDRIADYLWNFGDGATGTGMYCDHTYAAPGDYTVTLTVTDRSGNRASVSVPAKIVEVGAGKTEYALTTVRVVDAADKTTPPLKGAVVKVTNDAGFSETLSTDANGTVTLTLPAGACSLSVMCSGYMATARTVEVKPDQNGLFTYTVGMRGMSTDLVEGSLTARELTPDEVKHLGIDTSDPANNHVWKFESVFEFKPVPLIPGEKPQTTKLPLTAYYNEFGGYLGSSGGGWHRVPVDGKGGGDNSDQVLHRTGGKVGIFPVGRGLTLVVYGEAHWLKEMYEVDLVVSNLSYVDDITDCQAALRLPQGLSLAAVYGMDQELVHNIGTIPHRTAGAEQDQNTSWERWFVRGDMAGEYYMGATVTGKNPEQFVNYYTTDKAVKVYAGNALKLHITAPDMTFKGEDYHIRYELENVSTKPLGNVEFMITGSEQYTVDIGGGPAIEEQYGGMGYELPELAPGESIVINFHTTTWFDSYWESMPTGPVDVGYKLKNSFVNTLSGSTTRVPSEIITVHAPRGSFLEYLRDRGLDYVGGKIVDLVDKNFFMGAPIAQTTVMIFEASVEEKESQDPHTHAEITLTGGSFVEDVKNVEFEAGGGEGQVVPMGLQDAVVAYTDAPKGSYTISPDGRTMTMTKSGKVYVRGLSDGTATLTAKTNCFDLETKEWIPTTYTRQFDVDMSAAGSNAAELELKAPQQTTIAVPHKGETASLYIPYFLSDAEGKFLYEAPNAVWTVEGENTAGVTVKNGVLTLDSTAQAGEYTVRLTVDKTKTAVQTVTVTREPSVPTGIALYRDGTEVTGEDSLLIPVTDRTDSYTYTAKLEDQYGADLKGQLTWTVPENTSGAALENGVITVNKNTAPGRMVIRVTDGRLTSDLTVYIGGLEVDWSGVEAAISGAQYTYGDPNSKAVLPAKGTASAAGTTVSGSFAYADGSAVQDAGKRTVTVSFTADDQAGAYAGITLSRSFEIDIAPRALTEDLLNITGTYTYTGEAITPTYTVGKLVSGRDYTAAVTDNENAGDGTVTVTGKGNYTGEISKTFRIAPKPLTEDLLNITGTYTYTGEAITPTYTVGKLVSGRDYTAVVTDNENAGDGTLTVTGKGNYTGEISKTFAIGQADLTAISVTVTGEPQVGQTLTAALKAKAELTWQWYRNGNPIAGAVNSTYTVTADDRGCSLTVEAAAKRNYTGTAVSGELSVPAAAPAQPVLKARAGDGKVVLSWSAPAANGSAITGYEIWMNGEKLADLAGNKTGYTASGLTNGTEYSFVLKAINAVGETASQAVTAVPKVPVVPPTPPEPPMPPEPPTGQVEIPEAENGSVSVDTEHTAPGEKVEITVKPNEGFVVDEIIVTDKEGNRIPVTEENGKLSFVMPESGVTITTTFREQAVNPFTDVKEEDYFFAPVLWAVEHKVTAGISDTAFGPDLGCTRAQIVTFLWNAAGQPEPAGMTSPFTDVKEGDWYCKAVLWAAQQNITAGISETEFGAELICTRAQAMTFLWKYLARPDVRADMPFTDVAQTDWYFESVNWAVANGITAGTSGTTFGSGDDCTRAQIVTFLYRALNR